MRGCIFWYLFCWYFWKTYCKPSCFLRKQVYCPRPLLPDLGIQWHPKPQSKKHLTRYPLVIWLYLLWRYFASRGVWGQEVHWSTFSAAHLSRCLQIFQKSAEKPTENSKTFVCWSHHCAPHIMVFLHQSKTVSITPKQKTKTCFWAKPR